MEDDGSVCFDVAADPATVRARLSAGLVPMRSLWFPTPAELRAWDRATAPLYLRRASGGAVEVGPRLGNLQAARLCPSVVLTFTPIDGGTRVQGRAAMPVFAWRLLAIVTVLGVLWAGVIGGAWVTGGPAARGWPFCAVLLGAVLAVHTLARGPGRDALAVGLRALPGVASDPNAGSDDW